MYENGKTELKKVIPFEENGHWYMRLDYEYEDESGKHLHILPKVSFPHTLENIPIIRNCFFAPIWDIAVSEYLMTKEEIEEKLGYQIEIVSK